MKSSGVILIQIFLTLFTFSALAQKVEVKVILFLDANGDCQKQSNEPIFKMNSPLWHLIKNSGGNISVNSSSSADTLKMSLNNSSNYSIRIRSFDTSSFININCSNSDSFYPFSVGLNDTLIYVPLKDSITKFISSADPQVSAYCKDYPVNIEYICVKYSGSVKVIFNWGDGMKDTIMEAQPAGEFRPYIPHLYSTEGVKNITIELYNKSWTLLKIDSVIHTAEKCHKITGKLFADIDKNCVNNTEPVLKFKPLLLFNSTLGGVTLAYTDSLGNYQFNVKNGSYLLKADIRKLTCKDTIITNEDYIKFTVAGANIVKDIPLKDTFYLQKAFLLPQKFYLCNGDTLILKPNILASSIFNTIINYGNGKRDTFLNDIPNTIRHMYQSSVSGLKKIVAYIYNSSWVLKDSTTDSIVLNICNKKLMGKVYVDYNPNCLFNGSIDPVVPNYRIVVKDSNNLIRKIVFTDVNGNYSFDYDTNLSIKVYVNDIISCNGGKNFYSIAANSPSTGVKDFPINRDSLDVSIYLVRRGIIFPGDSLKLSLMNNSLIPFSFLANYRSFIPNKSSVTRANNAKSFSLTGSNAYAQYGTNSVSNYLVYNFSTTTQSTDTFCFNARLAKVNSELDTTNNETTWCIVARNSYDPNDKQVAIRSMQKNGDFTDRNDALVYTVRFQNTGTAPARNIYILDSLTHKLDLNTFQFLTSSHQASLSLNENRMFRIDFKNINLPDSASNPMGSQGYFIYSIKPKANLDTGEIIENVANIYFDFNPPITTNTTKNRFVRKSQTDFNWTSEVQSPIVMDRLFIYPNPVSKTINFSNINLKQYRLFSAIGHELMHGSCEEGLDVSQLQQGFYFIIVNLKNTEYHFKFIKE
jgi:uncharacterized repeat protein (TIGR01451 family)